MRAEGSAPDRRESGVQNLLRRRNRAHARSRGAGAWSGIGDPWIVINGVAPQYVANLHFRNHAGSSGARNLARRRREMTEGDGAELKSVKRAA
jgi:hypothetical protein